MRARLLSIILLIPLFFACSQSSTWFEIVSPEPTVALASINVLDRNGFSETICSQDRLKKFDNIDFLKPQPYQKVLRIYQRDEKGNICAFINSYYPNGQPRQYLEIVNNRAYGTYREWHQNGILKVDTFVIGGEPDIDMVSERSWLFDGISRAWDEEGHLVAEIPYSQGELQGVSYYYHPNGAPWKNIPCDKGAVHGVMEIYLDNGTLLQTAEYHLGQKQGRSVRYWHEGAIACEESYCNNLLKQGKYYDQKGKLLSSIEDGSGFRVLFGKENVNELHEFQKGIEEGEVKIFDIDGFLAKRYFTKNNLKDGEEIEYYSPKKAQGAELKPKLSIKWVEGRIHGIVKTWYPSGAQESQREMSQNKKNGILTGWYPDGHLMLAEVYENDKLLDGKYFMSGENSPISEVKEGKGTATLFDSSGNLLRKVNYFHSRPVL